MAFSFGTPAPAGAPNPFATPAPPAAGFGFGAAPAAPATPYGFGAPAPPAAGFGFGAAPAAPAAGFGFGAPAQPGATPAAQTGLGVGGFGSPPRAAAGAAPAGGFGFGAPAAAPAAAGFGFAPAAAVAPTAGKSMSITGQYLLQWDNVYNAKHPDCKFRSFLYTMCTPGHTEQAIARERANNPGIKEEQWILAKRANPDPEKMYPQPVHFMAGLKQRALKQKHNVEELHRVADAIATKSNELAALQEKNASTHKKLMQDLVMTRRKLLAVTSKIEVLRQTGLQLGPEKHTVLERTNSLLMLLNAPNRFKALNSELQCGLDSKLRQMRTAAASAVLPSTTEGGRAGTGTVTQPRLVAARGAIDLEVIQEWTKFLDRMGGGLTAMQQTLHKDVDDLMAIAKARDGQRR